MTARVIAAALAAILSLTTHAVAAPVVLGAIEASDEHGPYTLTVMRDDIGRTWARPMWSDGYVGNATTIGAMCDDQTLYVDGKAEMLYNLPPDAIGHRLFALICNR